MTAAAASPIVAVMRAVEAVATAAQRDPEVWRARRVRRWAVDYVSAALDLNDDMPEERREVLIERMVGAALALRELGVDVALLRQMVAELVVRP